MIFLPFLIVCLSFFASCASPPGPRQAILVVLDAARPDHFSCYGYDKATTPEIDRLSRAGAVFLNCYAQGTETRTSLPRLLYSRYFSPEIFPNHHSIPYSDPGRLFQIVDAAAIALPRALEARGFMTTAISAHEWITEGTAFAREFLELQDLQSVLPFDRKYAYPRADKVVDRAIAWIGKNLDRDYFLYLHIMDTHFPHFFEGDARTFYGAREYKGEAFEPTGLPKNPAGDFIQDDRRYLSALYDGGLRYADRELGRLFSALKKWGRDKETLVVITSDHGEFLLERKGRISHGGTWHESLARIPLVVHYPLRVKPRRSERLCEQIDIAPTMLGLLEVPFPAGKSADGVNLFAGVAAGSPAGDEAGGTAVSELGIRAGHQKLVFNFGADSVLGESIPELAGLNLELYDLETDPGETRNLVSTMPAAAAELLSVFRAKMTSPYRRYRESVTRAQPACSFAISCSSFGPGIPVVSVPVEERVARLLEIPSPNGWLGRNSWDNSWLFAHRGAVPLKISFSIPDGKYVLMADVQGSALLISKGRRMLVKSAKMEGHLRWDPEPAELGEIEITDEVFSATLYPQADLPWFAIRYLGFDPIIDGKRGGRYDEEREKRLKSLGYLK
jgi:arylsulfatase A-like enzyme